jgi:NADH-quinone oxidoreductase subunit M
LGFCVLGIFVFRPEAIEGAIYQMFSHGVSTGALFILVGMLYDRRHTRLISEFGGLATSLPVYSTFFLMVTLASLGLPLLNGFVGEFLIIVGSYYRHAAYAALAAAGVVLAAVYLLWMYQRVFYGEITNEKNRTLPDCDFREKLILTVIVIVIIVMGVYPQPFLRRMDRGVDSLMMRLESHSVMLVDRADPPALAGAGVKNERWGIGNRESGTTVRSPIPPSQFPYPTTPLPAAHCLGPTAYSLLPTASEGVGR